MVNIKMSEVFDSTKTKEIIYKNVRAKVRPNTSDAFIVEEVIGGTYRKLNIQTDDVVVDIGLNIGMFVIWALLQGANRVYAFEAEPQNYNLALQNVALNELSAKATLYNQAVIGTNEKTRNFAINLHRNKGAHSLVPKRGRHKMIVDCVNINKVLADINPTVVKMDIEGGEYECLKATKTFDGIRELILEFHHAHLNDIKTHEKYNEILSLLRSRFSTVEARNSEDIGGAWTGLIYCKA